MNHKRGKPKHLRAGCLHCKPHKDERMAKEPPASVARRLQDDPVLEAESYTLWFYWDWWGDEGSVEEILADRDARLLEVMRSLTDEAERCFRLRYDKSHSF